MVFAKKLQALGVHMLMMLDRCQVIPIAIDCRRSATIITRDAVFDERLGVCSIERPLNFEQTSLILSLGDLLNHIERVCQDSKNDIEEEKGAN